MKKLQVIYRFCEAEQSPESFKEERPLWFSKIRSFTTFYDAFGGRSDTDIICLQDGPDGRLSEYIKSFPKVKLEKIDARSNKESLLKTFDLANQTQWDFVYFVEDDYLHLPEAEEILREGLEKFPIVTLYDHLDRYTRNDDITLGKDEVYLTKSTHWRTAESTTCTWATNKADWAYIEEYARKYQLKDRDLFRALYGIGVRLVTPIPGRATHVNKHFFSPCVDWKTLGVFK